MITEALQHCRGIGPIRLRQIHQSGVRSWSDVLNAPQCLPEWLRNELVAESERCLRALADDDIGYFVDCLSPHDRWRIVAHYIDRCSYFDIETTGLEIDDTITTIVCWHRDQLHTFVEHENLDDFLDLLDDIDLLVSFNGSTFDVPRVLDVFHIPDLPCPHLDLRWPCYYRNLHGGLKQISSEIGLQRPDDLEDADGSLAVRLWSLWRHSGDAEAKNLLLRYCAADVLLLRGVAQHIADQPVTVHNEFQTALPAANHVAAVPGPHSQRKKQLAAVFGSASPTKLRTRR